MRLLDRIPSRLLALVSCTVLGLVSFASAQTYDKCGDLVQGVTCPVMFLDDDGDLWLLADTGGFSVGDNVRVTSNNFDPFCFSICNQGNGCMFSNTIAPCAPPATPYCFGDGSGTACPCGNPGDAGEGCRNSSGSGGIAASTGGGSIAANNLGVTATQLIQNQPALLFGGDNSLNGGAGLVFGDGLRCAGGNIRRLGVRVPNASGTASWGPGLAGQGGYVSGQTARLQVWYRDPVGGPCGTTFNLTNGLELTFTP